MLDLICHLCDDYYYSVEFDTDEELDEHLEAEHNWCPFCCHDYDTPAELLNHQIDKHNLCWICREYFDSRSNLRHHNLIHTARLIECPGCPRKFPTESAMVLHLEVGRCQSGLSCDDIDRFACDCRQSPKFLVNGDELRYICPTCEGTFKFMSGLLQHAESERCDENLDERYSPLAIFLRYLKSRITHSDKGYRHTTQ
ncbi:hypothetical protein BBK36DRAFT_1123676 [Trichoderma citrinoviride]|uniref:C2H2-type domain-containing protein n=1 Tax=Trichoderma citrinoviride TaxID=58853 RepID=A0A2T4B650_9HYPO|nr:hypothetical protein BBK36DRAFT_1123676 [Trichoderma citrinoviride]PTB64816.1 hypothetical protein BBK36DRAFT_1123676 [Trichoderma citrinoviride]